MGFGERLGRVGPPDAKGSAEIECVDLQGGSASIRAGILKQCRLSEGDMIAFDGQADSMGQINVSAPCWTCCSPSWLKRLYPDDGANGNAEADAGADAGAGTTSNYMKNIRPPPMKIRRIGIS